MGNNSHSLKAILIYEAHIDITPVILLIVIGGFFYFCIQYEPNSTWLEKTS